MQRRRLRRVEHTEQVFYNLALCGLRVLCGKITRLRTAFAKRIARSIYFYQKGAKIILTHGFIKKTEKTPRKEIERAKELRSLYHKGRENNI